MKFLKNSKSTARVVLPTRAMKFLTDFVLLLFVPGKEISTIWLHLPLIDGYKTEEINKRYKVLIYLGVKIFI